MFCSNLGDLVYTCMMCASRTNTTIVSSGGSFEMGFFHPGNSRNQYLGIWYKKISVKTVVWVANREIPLIDSSGVLAIINPGILALVDGTGTVIWFANVTGSTQNPIAQLMDSGNLVVKDANDKSEHFLWQSFDYPCDTLLPGMKLGKNFETGLERQISSWKSRDDPARGEFTYRCDPQGYPQNILLSSGSGEVFRTGPWNVRQTDSNGKKRQIVAVTLALLIGHLLLGISLIVYLRKRKRKNSQLNREGILMHKSEQSYTNKTQKEDLELPLFDLTVIADSTNNFSINNKLGEGGFGPVYKGTLEGGQEIAVKRLSKNSSQGFDEFKNELICIAKLQHRNLVKLLGCCLQGEETMLIYEYMPNKSLDYFIFDQSQSTLLDWSKRFHIINGIARGLLYLHQDSRLRIIHRDLKASNILLDIDMNPKISDFGIARTFGGNETEANTNRVIGTYGYMSPEYATDGLFSVKSDVFSFGVLVLEIVSGKKNRSFNHPEHRHNLLGH
ncbi:G-type lectin S-receptor-like serine/threonine-protein kinase SD1-1, partial [Camellia lanceoleosa]